MTHDETSKNDPGRLKDKSSFEKTARMYETESDTDSYRALSLYISKLTPEREALFSCLATPKTKQSFTTSGTKSVFLVLKLSAA